MHNEGDKIADIKTHLRELSVAVGAGSIIKGEYHLDIIPDSESFFEECEEYVEGNLISARNILDVDIRSGEYSSIVRNGLKMANAICEEFSFLPDDKIVWVGDDTQKDDPVDLVIGKYGFSLKEDSYILENMGLYKYLTLMTGKQFERGLHVFKTFSPDEYEEWFLYSFERMIKSKDWKYNKGNYYSA